MFDMTYIEYYAMIGGAHAVESNSVRDYVDGVIAKVLDFEYISKRTIKSALSTAKIHYFGGERTWAINTLEIYNKRRGEIKKMTYNRIKRVIGNKINAMIRRDQGPDVMVMQQEINFIAEVIGRYKNLHKRIKLAKYAEIAFSDYQVKHGSEGWIVHGRPFARIRVAAHKKLKAKKKGRKK